MKVAEEVFLERDFKELGSSKSLIFLSLGGVTVTVPLGGDGVGVGVPGEGGAEVGGVGGV